MKLFDSDEQLRRFIPNSITAVRGELSLLQRLESFLSMAEDWVGENITSEAAFDYICSLNENDSYRLTTSRLVVAEALRRAIPSLDIVLTPNGFAVVQTANLAPASKHRVDNLVNSMVKLRDECIVSLLQMLPQLDSWANSDRSEFFSDTLFPNINFFDRVNGEESKWDKYLELRPKIVDLEESLADDWLSPELMSALRQELFKDNANLKRRKLTELIRSQITDYLLNGSFSSRRLADIVNIVRLDEINFPEWHRSETAELFSPPIFKNKKNAAGYFF